MDFDREKKRLEQRLKAAQGKLEAATNRRKLLKQRLRTTSNTLRDKAEKWHRFGLAHHDREAGYTGEHALARMALRSMPFDDYVRYVRQYSDEGKRTLLSSEVAMVTSNLEQLTKVGQSILLRRDRAAYAKEQGEWEAWQERNPAQTSWRERKPSKGQLELVIRIAEAKELAAPEVLTRGQAHDWIAEHGGNPRLSGFQGQPGQVA